MRFHEMSLNDGNGTCPLKVFHSSKVKTGKRAFWEHHHTACELSVVCSGAGRYTVSGKNYAFSKDDVFLFGSHEVHCITNISPDSPFDLLNIQFEPRILWGGNGTFGVKLLQIFFNRSSLFENRIQRDNPATKQIRDGIFALERELAEKKFGFEMKAKILLFDMLLTLSRNYGYINQAKDGASVSSDVLNQITLAANFIDENLERDITLDEIAKYAAMNKTYFSTMFKKLNGISTWEYITIKRVEKAVALIKTTSLSKLEIAQRCGFNSSSNFYKAFHKVTGRAPKDI